jgi:hypothetical protein
MNIYHLYFVGDHGRSAIIVAKDEDHARLQAAMQEKHGGWDEAKIQRVGQTIDVDFRSGDGGVLAIERIGNGIRHAN